jgi:hypothetical protein
MQPLSLQDEEGDGENDDNGKDDELVRDIEHDYGCD